MSYVTRCPPFVAVSDKPISHFDAPGTDTLSALPQRWPVVEDRLLKMQQAFRATGGVLAGDALTVILRCRSDQPLSLLARWIVNRQVVCFEANGQAWLPMFQFEAGGVGVRAVVQKVICELRDVFDDWELTEWFAAPSSWLGGVSPANASAIDPNGVLQAARADRFVAAG